MNKPDRINLQNNSEGCNFNSERGVNSDFLTNIHVTTIIFCINVSKPGMRYTQGKY